MDPEIYSKEWFDKHMHPNTPDDLRKAVEHIVRSYRIEGICDPGYIANVIAMHTGRGDGMSVFWPTKDLPNIEMKVGFREQLMCDACDNIILDDDAIIHTHTALDFGGEGLKITHVGCVDKVPRG